jgi:hypothetical protein
MDLASCLNTKVHPAQIIYTSYGIDSWENKESGKSDPTGLIVTRNIKRYL